MEIASKFYLFLLCYTASTGRGHYSYRLAIIFKNKSDLIDKLCHASNVHKEELEENNIFLQKHKIIVDKKKAEKYEISELEKRKLNSEIQLKVNEANKNQHNDISIIKTICRLYVKGADLNWQNYYTNNNSKISIPVYQFDKERCWICDETKKNINVITDKKLNEKEEQLCIICAEVIGLYEINIEKSFYELGVDSIIAAKIVNIINKELSINIKLRDILSARNIMEFVNSVSSIYLNNNSIATVEYKKINVLQNKEYYVSSSAQKRMYVMQKSNEDSLMYNITGVLEINGKLDERRLEESFQKLIARHESLRTSFKLIDGDIYQKINKELDVSIIKLEVSEEMLTDKIKELIRKFDLELAPLYRIYLTNISENRNILIFDIHHIISDGMSNRIIINELLELYNGNTLSEITVQYKDYAEWQNKYLMSSEIIEQEKYWVDRFSNEIPLLDLPLDYKRGRFRTYEGKVINYIVNEELTKLIKELAISCNTTLYNVLLSAFYILLYKYTGQEDIIVGSPVSGRSTYEQDMIVGMFINTLAMRNYPSGNKNFLSFLKEVSDNTISANSNSEYQFQMLINKINLRRDTSRNPLFDVMFILQNIDIKSIKVGNLEFRPRSFKNDTSLYDITLEAIEEDNKINFSMEYCVDLFNESTIKRFCNSYINILNEISQNPNKLINNVDILSDNEKDKILNQFNNTEVKYEDDKTIHELFERTVERIPNKIAIKFKNISLTYSELNKRANQLAKLLRIEGIQRNDIVALMVERSVEMIVGILAILKSGAAYLPIDPEYPISRIQYMLVNSEAKLLLTSKACINKINFQGKYIQLDDEEIYTGANVNLQNVNTSDDLIYVIYTSGSTGNPKGVMLSHKGVNNFAIAMSEIIDFHESKVILNLTTISFDIFVLETLVPLITGVQIVIAAEEDQIDPKRISNLIEKEKINMLQLTPSRMQLLLKGVSDKSTFLGISEIMIGGESLSSTLLNSIKKVTKARIYNMYGPTETTVWSTVKDLTDSDKITIGKGVANTKIFIVDRYNRIAPIGVSGELCIAGDGLALGYLKNKELTDTKFIENPFERSGKMYRTGDLAKWLPNGEIEFLQRIDHQVKIRGYRIELGEIEKTLESIPKIKNSVVVPVEEEDGNKYLVAYYVLNEKKISKEEIKNYLYSKLPDYMVPSFYVQLIKLPLTPNGKVDRKLLPDVKIEVAESEEKSKLKLPKNKIERNILGIWREVLKHNSIGIDDNFFDVGGNSLLLVQMHSKINTLYPEVIEVADIFAYPTIHKLSELIISRSCENKIKGINLPKEYLNLEDNENLESFVEFKIDGQSSEKLKNLGIKYEVSVDSIMKGIFIYLIHEISNMNEISIQVQCDDKEELFKLDVEFNNINTIENLFSIVENKTKNLDGIFISRSEISNSTKDIIFIFVPDGKKSSNLLEFGDIVLKVNCFKEYIGCSLEYNGSKLNKSKMEQLVYSYLKLIQVIIKRS
ncbi:amino acid adenylation domain-containing protein [Clostridium sp. LP20]|uniref:non-ribosomal peptide synthetase n=1 Tax=Clostridium sp. LP20 TaxID=3418665 RepID=UPI003EE77938